MARSPNPAHVDAGEEMIRTHSAAESFDSTGTTIYSQPTFDEAQYVLITSLGRQTLSSERYPLQEGLLFMQMKSRLNGFEHHGTYDRAEDAMAVALGRHVHPPGEQSLRRRSSYPSSQSTIHIFEEEDNIDVSSSKAVPNESLMKVHVAYHLFPSERQIYDEDLTSHDRESANDESQEEEENVINVSSSETVSPTSDEFQLQLLLAAANAEYAKLMAEEEAHCRQTFQQLLRAAELIIAPVVEEDLARSDPILIGKIPREDEVLQQPEQHMEWSPTNASRNRSE